MARRATEIYTYKVYNDGGAYIALRMQNKKGFSGGRKLIAEEPVSVEETEAIQHSDGYENMIDHAICADESEFKPSKRISTRGEEFKKYYIQSMGLKWLARREYIAERMYKYFDSEEELYNYLDYKMRNAYRAASARRSRCKRRATLHKLDLFCTFTYDSKKMNEKVFRVKLLNTLRHFASRKGWKYMGTWERGDKGRLHFHALMHIPEGTMSGEIEHRREYDPVRKRMAEFETNTFFERAFGRNTFDKIDGIALNYTTAINYIVKYLEKDGGRLICSRGLKTFIETQIAVEDILAPLHPDAPYDDRKYILFDDFKVWDKNGRCLGAFKRSMLRQLILIN